MYVDIWYVSSNTIFLCGSFKVVATKQWKNISRVKEISKIFFCCYCCGAKPSLPHGVSSKHSSLPVISFEIMINHKGTKQKERKGHSDSLLVNHGGAKEGCLPGWRKRSRSIISLQWEMQPSGTGWGRSKDWPLLAKRMSQSGKETKVPTYKETKRWVPWGLKFKARSLEHSLRKISQSLNKNDSFISFSRISNCPTSMCLNTIWSPLLKCGYWFFIKSCRALITCILTDSKCGSTTLWEALLPLSILCHIPHTPHQKTEAIWVKLPL